MKTTTTEPTRAAFLDACNGRCRARLFSGEDYFAFLCALDVAHSCASDRAPYYQSSDAGGVANSYGSTTTTAQWAVWTTPTGGILIAIRAASKVSGRTVPCAYYMGERAYRRDFDAGTVVCQESA